MLEKKSWYIMEAKKFRNKNWGRPPFSSKRFLVHIRPWQNPKWQKSKFFFTKRTSMKLLANYYFPIFIFWSNLSSTVVSKKSSKMPKFASGAALSGFFHISALKALRLSQNWKNAKNTKSGLKKPLFLAIFSNSTQLQLNISASNH